MLTNDFYNILCEKSLTYKVEKNKNKKVQENDTIKDNNYKVTMILHYISLLKFVIFSHSVL